MALKSSATSVFLKQRLAPFGKSLPFASKMDVKSKRPLEELESSSPATQSMTGRRRARTAESEAAQDEALSNEPDGVEDISMEEGEEGDGEAKEEEGGEGVESDEEQAEEEESNELGDGPERAIVNSYNDFQANCNKWHNSILRMNNAVSLQSWCPLQFAPRDQG